MDNMSVFISDSLAAIAHGFHQYDAYVFDANDTIFFARELEHIEETMFEFDLKVLKHRAYIPVDNTPDPGADTVTYRLFEKIGIAAIINNFANDLPSADVLGSEFRAPVRSIATSIRFSTHDLRRARMADVPLDSMKAASAQRAVDERESAIAWNGDADSGLPGLLTNANIPLISAAAAAGGGNAPEWDGPDKTPDETIQDVSTAVATVRKTTKGARSVDTLLLPIDQYNKIANTPRSIHSDITVLQWISRPGNAFNISAVDWVNEFDTPGGLFSGDIALFYERNPQVLSQRITMERVILPMQQRNLEFVIPVEARNGGVVVRYPLACLFMDDI